MKIDVNKVAGFLLWYGNDGRPNRIGLVRYHDRDLPGEHMRLIAEAIASDPETQKLWEKIQRDLEPLTGEQLQSEWESLCGKIPEPERAGLKIRREGPPSEEPKEDPIKAPSRISVLLEKAEAEIVILLTRLGLDPSNLRSKSMVGPLRDWLADAAEVIQSGSNRRPSYEGVRGERGTGSSPDLEMSLAERWSKLAWDLKLKEALLSEEMPELAAALAEVLQVAKQSPPDSNPGSSESRRVLTLDFRGLESWAGNLASCLASRSHCVSHEFGYGLLQSLTNLGERTQDQPASLENAVMYS